MREGAATRIRGAHVTTFNRRVPILAAIAALALLALLVVGATRVTGQERGANDWRVRGQLQAWDGDLWIVDAKPLVVPPALSAVTAPTLGATIDASGVFDDSGRRVARRLTAAPGGTPAATLLTASVDGAIDELSGERWVVGGRQVRVLSSAQLVAADGVSDPRTLATPGNLAAVEGYALADGVLLAMTVTLRSEAPVSAPTTAPAAAPVVAPTEPAATSTPTLELTATSESTPRPDPAPAPANSVQSPMDQPPTPESTNGSDGTGDGGSDDGADKQPKPDKPDKPDKPGKGGDKQQSRTAGGGPA